MFTQTRPAVDWAATSDGSFFYADDVRGYGHVYGRLTWSEPGRAAVTVWGPTFAAVEAYLDASAMTRIITRREFELARDAGFPQMGVPDAA